jgi:predicted Zn-dependent peptidase
LVKSGTSTLSAAQIEEEIDYYGASLGIGFGNDWSEVTVFALNKHLEPMLGLAQQLLADATFPEAELQHEVAQRKHRLSMSREKVDYLAKVAFLESLHGPDHPYGYRRSEQTLDAVTCDDLKTFFANHYTSHGAMLFVAGHVGDADMQLVEQHLGQGFPRQGTTSPLQGDGMLPPAVNRFVEKKDAVQASIRMGRLVPLPGHPDYAGLRVLNILLGGYFGSRLMLNLRETHGYTYGVRSVISASMHRAQLTIATEVGQQYVDDSVKQIRLELERLRHELVPDEELTLMRNFTLGALLSSTDGPFRSGQVIKDLVLDGRGPTAFEHYVDTLRTITAKELQRLAGQYLDPSDMTLVVAGGARAQ